MTTPDVTITLEAIIERIEKMPDAQILALEKYLADRRRKIEDEQLLAEMREIYKNVPPPNLKGGTMDVQKLEEAIASFREGLTDEELDEIARAMRGEL